MTDIIVPDASVLLKWAFASPEESDRENALALLDSWLEGRVEIVVPALWAFEVGNVLMLKSPETAQETMEIFLGYNFNEFDTTVELCRETFNLMKKYDVTFYDGVYHSVALLNKGLLLTADEAYYSRVKDAGNIVGLNEWV